MEPITVTFQRFKVKTEGKSNLETRRETLGARRKDGDT